MLQAFDPNEWCLKNGLLSGGLNPWPLSHESSALTTIPRLLAWASNSSEKTSDNFFSLVMKTGELILLDFIMFYNQYQWLLNQKKVWGCGCLLTILIFSFQLVSLILAWLQRKKNERIIERNKYKCILDGRMLY